MSDALSHICFKAVFSNSHSFHGYSQFTYGNAKTQTSTHDLFDKHVFSYNLDVLRFPRSVTIVVLVINYDLKHEYISSKTLAMTI